MASPAEGQPSESRRKRARHVPKAKPPLDLNAIPRKTPTERWAKSVEGRIGALEKERKRLLGENASLRSELDRLRPEYSRIREAYGNVVANNYLSAVMIALGGGAISLASYFEPPARPLIACAGVVTLGCGLIRSE